MDTKGYHSLVIPGLTETVEEEERGRNMISRRANNCTTNGLVEDSSIAWEVKRQIWLNLRHQQHCSGSQEQTNTEGVEVEVGGRKRQVNQATVERAKYLGELLDEAIQQDALIREMKGRNLPTPLPRVASPSSDASLALPVASNSASSSISGLSGLAKENELTREEEPDGGIVIRIDDDKKTLAKATVAILSSFSSGKILKNPLPLSLVTKLYYRSWLSDGTIPYDYDVSASNPTTPVLSLAPPEPGRLSRPSTMTTVVLSSPPKSRSIELRADDGGGESPKSTGLKMEASSKWRTEKDFESSASDVI